MEQIIEKLEAQLKKLKDFYENEQKLTEKSDFAISSGRGEREGNANEKGGAGKGKEKRGSGRGKKQNSENLAIFTNKWRKNQAKNNNVFQFYQKWKEKIFK